MRKKKLRFPAYATIIGPGTEIDGDIRFVGGLHVDGKVTGDISGQSEGDCGLTLGEAGTIEGNLDVAHVVIGGTVIGDVRATQRAELASQARIAGTLLYGALDMTEGAEVNGKLLHIDEAETPRLAFQGAVDETSQTSATDEVVDPGDEPGQRGST
ncbi:MAG: polymer-forming cytoskeletal protein [Pseudomonadota bacterium]|nr:polymer-forming cytoskeletal protein [Pseudomonadota bacterium]